MDKFSEQDMTPEYLHFTGSDRVFAPAELAALFQAALDQRYGAGFQVFIHDVDAGEYSDDVLLQIIAPCEALKTPYQEGV